MSELHERQAQPKRPRGRPKSIDPLETISVRLPKKYHDRLFEVSKEKKDPNMGVTMRRIMILHLRDEPAS